MARRVSPYSSKKGTEFYSCDKNETLLSDKPTTIFPSVSLSTVTSVSIPKHPHEAIDRTKDPERLELVKESISQLLQKSAIVFVRESRKTDERTGEEWSSHERERVDEQNSSPARNRSQYSGVISTEIRVQHRRQSVREEEKYCLAGEGVEREVVANFVEESGGEESRDGGDCFRSERFADALLDSGVGGGLVGKSIRLRRTEGVNLKAHSREGVN